MPDKKNKFFIMGNPGTNIGDVAAMYGIVYGLKNFFPDSQLSVSYSGNADISGIQKKVNCFYRDEDIFSKRGIISLLLDLLLRIKKPFIHDLKTADAVIFAPGACGLHKYNYNHWIKLYITILLLKSRKNIIVFHGCSMGPFNAHLYLLKKILNKADLIMLRDRTSVQKLTKMQLNVSKYLVTGDSAMIIQTEKRKTAVKEKVVGIIPMDFSRMSVNHVSNENERMIKCFADAVNYLYRQYEISKIHFISHIPGDRKEQQIIKRIIKQIHFKIKYEIINHTSPLDALKEYEKLYFCISARHHGGAFALKMGVPSICIAYEHKAFGFYRQYNLEEYVIDIKKLTSDSLINCLDKGIENYSVIEEKIQKNNKAVRNNALKNTQNIKKVLDKKGNKNKKVVFVLTDPTLHIVGGYKMVYLYSNALIKHGYDVEIAYTSHINSPKEYVYSIFRKIVLLQGVSWFDIDPNIKLTYITYRDNMVLPDADCYIGTASALMPALYKSISKGELVHFIQDHETWVLPEAELFKIYQLDTHKIVVSTWLKEIVDKYANRTSIKLANAIDTNIFNVSVPNNKRYPHSIMMLYHDDLRKGCERGIEIIKKIKTEVPDLRCILFGSPKRNKNIPKWIKYYRNVKQKELAQLYNSVSVFFSTSYSEGYGLTGLESMACGCALVSTDTLGVREYAQNGFNALLSDPNDDEALFNNLLMAIKNEDIRDRLSYNASAFSKKYSQSEHNKVFCKVIGDLINGV